MIAILTVVVALAALVLTLADRRRGRRARGRAAALLATRQAPGRRRWPGLPVRVRAWGVPAVAGLAGGVFVGGLPGPAVGGGVAWGVWCLGKRRARARGAAGEAAEEERAETARQLPLAADLLAACASAGAPPGESAEAVGRSLGGPVGERLVRTAAELRLGGEPAEVWRRFGAIPGAEGLARCLERAASSGAPAADAVARHAEGLRAARARTAAARAQRAQVLITAPVGLCFLPAFLAVGVAPVVIGLASGLLGGR
ncbi:type II secretion system F family protein [Streptomyces sp. SKN60]|uniref:type II secretion system F family protein n=1 Tax=Streptomyces sp. SKN60 TaxID=2855506 RepID=UPI002245504A|nr:type II secretion system F family protein [Streptomyces sp. SKN60]MCX2182246.1 type II secretion system F family protein [Streptomyces sp. SKN60]